MHHDGGTINRAEGEQGFDQFAETGKLHGKRTHRNLVEIVDEMEVRTADECLVLLHEIDLSGDLVGIHEIVRAQPSEVFASGSTQAVVQGATRTSVGFAEVMDPGTEGIQLILMNGRTVVHDEYFDIRVRLVEHASNRLVDVRTIVERNNYADERKKIIIRHSYLQTE